MLPFCEERSGSKFTCIVLWRYERGPTESRRRLTDAFPEEINDIQFTWNSVICWKSHFSVTTQMFGLHMEMPGLLVIISKCPTAFVEKRAWMHLVKNASMYYVIIIFMSHSSSTMTQMIKILCYLLYISLLLSHSYMVKFISGQGGRPCGPKQLDKALKK